MKIGIMKPYFIPYIGYWQLMAAVDKYVIYDDVNFIKGGWINRNRILLEKKPKYFNVQLIGAGSYKKINEIEVENDKHIVNKKLRMIEAAYRKAPFYADVYTILKSILECDKKNLVEYIRNSFEAIGKYLGITTELIYSSSLDKNCSLKGSEKILAICKLLGATEYYNAIGGEKLYSFYDFLQNGIELKFLKTNNIIYKQNGETFYPNLSIIDVMMFNSREEVKKMLGEYTLIINKR